MVQLNPFKWGNKKKKKEKLKVEGLKKTISGSGGGRSGSKRRTDAKKTLNKMGHLTDKQTAQKDKKDRKAYDKEHKIVNRRGRTTGYKEGYDPKKGVQKKTTTSKTKSSTAPKKKMSSIERENRKRFGDAHVDKLIARQKAFRNRNKK